MRMLMNARTLLPLLIFFGVATLGIRIDALWQAAQHGAYPHPAHAETKQDTPPSQEAAPKQEDQGKAQNAQAPAPQAAPEPPAPSPQAASDDETSPAELEVLKQLSDRRDQLEKRSRELDTREALIKVGEQRVDQKIKEMQALRLQLQAMVDQINGAQQTQLENLVKIYETMKPKEAARIFESLDMPVLLGVIQRMKPKSTAPILAEMAPQKAKEVTVALTKQDQLPQPK